MEETSPEIQEKVKKEIEKINNESEKEQVIDLPTNNQIEQKQRKKMNILNEFFNSRSDLSSLEATKQEELESEFQNWLDNNYTYQKK